GRGRRAAPATSSRAARGTSPREGPGPGARPRRAGPSTTCRCSPPRARSAAPARDGRGRRGARASALGRSASRGPRGPRSRRRRRGGSSPALELAETSRQGLELARPPPLLLALRLDELGGRAGHEALVGEPAAGPLELAL